MTRADAIGLLVGVVIAAAGVAWTWGPGPALIAGGLGLAVAALLPGRGIRR